MKGDLAFRELLSKKRWARRQARGVAHLRATMGLSERRACSIGRADRKMVRYRSCRPPDTELRTQLRDLANARRRFGYRRLFILLRQDGERSASTASTGFIKRLGDGAALWESAGALSTCGMAYVTELVGRGGEARMSFFMRGTPLWCGPLG